MHIVSCLPGAVPATPQPLEQTAPKEGQPTPKHPYPPPRGGWLQIQSRGLWVQVYRDMDPPPPHTTLPLPWRRLTLIGDEE